MTQFTESGITLNFSDENWFRFQDCKKYKQLSHAYFKEMDYGWFDIQNNQCYLFELKDFSNSSLEEKTIESTACDIVKKTVDSMCMLLSIKHKYDPWGIEMSKSIFCPFVTFNAETKIYFITIIHCDIYTQKESIGFIRDKFKSKIRPYSELFNMYCLLLNHTQAKQYYPTIVQ